MIIRRISILEQNVLKALQSCQGREVALILREAQQAISDSEFECANACLQRAKYMEEICDMMQSCSHPYLRYNLQRAKNAINNHDTASASVYKKRAEVLRDFLEGLRSIFVSRDTAKADSHRCI
jgi:hypothetical protein